MSKYIIRNCPAFDEGDCASPTEHIPYATACEHIEDCEMKQIVEKCKKYIENYNDKVFYDEDDVKILMGKVMLSQFILSEVLDIQEVE